MKRPKDTYPHRVLEFALSGLPYLDCISMIQIPARHSTISRKLTEALINGAVSIRNTKERGEEKRYLISLFDGMLGDQICKCWPQREFSHQECGNMDWKGRFRLAQVSFTSLFLFWKRWIILMTNSSVELSQYASVFQAKHVNGPSAAGTAWERPRLSPSDEDSSTPVPFCSFHPLWVPLFSFFLASIVVLAI